MDNQRIGAFIRTLRKEKSLTQKDVAQQLHITDRAVSKWERGICAPDIALLEPLAELLGVSVSELLRGERAAEPERQKPAEAKEEVKAVLDYSKGEVARKMGAVQKKYLGLLAGCLVLALLLGGALLWRSGVLFLLDKKVSPNGESVIRVYSKEWDFWPLHFTLGDTVQTVGDIGPSMGGGNLYINYGGVYGGVNNPTAYEGLWWAPDSTKYVIAFRWLNEDTLHLELNDLVRNCGTNLTAGFNLYWWLTEQGLVPARDEPPKIDYQFLQWGKDSASMLIYYSYKDGEPHEGYFWYNCKTEVVTGILELGIG